MFWQKDPLNLVNYILSPCDRRGEHSKLLNVGNFPEDMDNENSIVSEKVPELANVLDGHAEHHVHHDDREDNDERDKD